MDIRWNGMICKSAVVSQSLASKTRIHYRCGTKDKEVQKSRPNNLLCAAVFMGIYWRHDSIHCTSMTVTFNAPKKTMNGVPLHFQIKHILGFGGGKAIGKEKVQWKRKQWIIFIFILYGVERTDFVTNHESFQSTIEADAMKLFEQMDLVTEFNSIKSPYLWRMP